MSTLSPSQLRAARALLNWSRADLSKKAGVSEQTIHRFENGLHQPSPHTEQRLFRILDVTGIEFLENQGVRLKSNTTEVFEGIDGFHRFFDFFYRHLETTGSDACLNIYDETILSKYRQNPLIHRTRMKAIIEKRHISLRILTTVSDFISYGYAKFRWQPQQIPIPIGFYAFGDCLALISLVDENKPHIVVVHSAPIAEGYRQGFNLAWNAAKPPPKKIPINTDRDKKPYPHSQSRA